MPPKRLTLFHPGCTSAWSTCTADSRHREPAQHQPCQRSGCPAAAAACRSAAAAADHGAPRRGCRHSRCHCQPDQSRSRHAAAAGVGRRGVPRAAAALWRAALPFGRAAGGAHGPGDAGLCVRQAPHTRRVRAAEGCTAGVLQGSRCMLAVDWSWACLCMLCMLLAMHPPAAITASLDVLLQAGERLIRAAWQQASQPQPQQEQEPQPLEAP